jgi:hypothetical protein
MKKLPWVAGFESEVILGDLGISRFEQDLERFGAMDEASPAFCRAVAKSLSEFTGRGWTTPLNPSKPGFYVIPEYGLDPLQWPSDRLAGVELLTPPLPLDEADAIRAQVTRAVYEIDGDFNFISSETTTEVFLRREPPA